MLSLSSSFGGINKDGRESRRHDHANQDGHTKLASRKGSADQEGDVVICVD